MKRAAEANVAAAQIAARLQMHQEVNGNGGGMHPEVAVGRMRKGTDSAALAWRRVLLKG